MTPKRNRFCVLYFMAATLVLCPFWDASAKGDVNLVELSKKVRPAVVLIETFDKDKKALGQGSGFFINQKGHLITNYHILEGAYSAEVKTFDGRMYPVKLVLAERQEVDLIKVLVDIPEKATKFVQVTNTVPEVAERVLVVGSPMGLDQTVSEGIVSAVRDIPAIGKIFQISAPISQGSSGSPVVNMKGQVIGVATFQLIEGQNLNFAVSGRQVLALKPEKKSKTLKEWSVGVSKKEIDAAEDLCRRGLIFLAAGEYEKALNYFKKALEEDNRYEMAWQGIGLYYTLLGRYKDAIEACKQAIRIKPDFARAWFDVGYCYRELSQYEEAIEAYKQAIRIEPNDATPHYFLGSAYEDLGGYQEAMEAFKQAIRIKPDFAEAHCSLGGVYTIAGRYTEALEAFKQAIRIKPDYVRAHCGLGVAYDSLGRYQEGVEAYKQAIRIKPDLAKPHYMLGLTYLQLGDKGSALDEYKILKTLDKEQANQLFNLIYK